jgi:hypothetical protein
MIIAASPPGITGPVGTGQFNPVSSLPLGVIPMVPIIKIIITTIGIVGLLIEIHGQRQRRHHHRVRLVIGIGVIGVGIITIFRDNTSCKQKCAADNHEQSEYCFFVHTSPWVPVLV